MNQRNVLITGASGGIGYEMAKIFAQNHYGLILVARSRGRLEEMRSEFSTLGVRVVILEKDLTRPNAAQEMYEELSRCNLRVHVLVNNAGFGEYGFFHRIPLQQQLQMMQLHMTVLTELTYLFAQDMIKQQYGRILNVGSISSFISTPMMSVYCATKAYVLAFSEALNSEFKGQGNISVTALCPGFTRTDFIMKAKFGQLETLINRIALPPDFVARQGYEALIRKKPVKVAGGLNVTMALLTRLIPRSWLQLAALMVFKDI